MIEKKGTAEKITEIAKNAAEFAKMWEIIEKKNNLCKCVSCNHLLSKSADGIYTLKYRGMACLIEGGKIKVACPICNTINEIK